MLKLFEHLGRTDVRRDAGDLELDVDLRTDRPDELASVLRSAAAGDVAPR